jgi:hypothetical protein
MCDAEVDWHERAFWQKLTRSVIFSAVVFSLFFINYEILEDVFAL